MSCSVLSCIGSVVNYISNSNIVIIFLDIWKVDWQICVQIDIEILFHFSIGSDIVESDADKIL